MGKLGSPRPPTTPYALSIVIPALNEAERLPQSLTKIRAFLQAQGWEATTEVIVVDDGSTDSTVAVTARMIRQWPQLTLLTLPHRGKGAAVRQGVLVARGDDIFLCDADLSMPIEQITRFLAPQAPAADVVIGSREAPGARRFGEPRYRHRMGRVFNLLVRLLVLGGIEDTQCGFKRMTRAAAQALCAEQRLNGLSFDVELLALARARGYTIAEIPIDWYHEAHSRVRPIRDTISMVRDIWTVRRRMRQVAFAPPPPQSAEPATQAPAGVERAEHQPVAVIQE
jgi:dolichyl-phosphate beta-glucosyltransferase